MTKLSLNVQLTYLSSLASLLRSGMPIIDSLEGARESVGAKGKLDHILATIEEGSKKGMALSTSFTMAGFGAQTIALVELGNNSGTLIESLNRSAERINNQIQIHRKITSAILYPAIVLTMTVGIVCFLTFYVFPKVLPIFQGKESTLPVATKVLIFLTHALSTYWWLILLLLLAASVGTIFAYRFVWFRHVTELMSLRIPILSKLISYRRSADLFGTVGTLLLHGLPLKDALSSFHRSARLLVFKKYILLIENSIVSGGLLSMAFKTCNKNRLKILPTFVDRIISVGERSGTLPESCLTIEKESDRRSSLLMDRMTDMVEPVLMIIMGLSVGSVALAIIMPIYEITRQLQH